MFSLFCFTVYNKNNANISKAYENNYETPKIFFLLQIQLKPVRIEISMALDLNRLCFVNSGLESLFSKETTFLVKKLSCNSIICSERYNYEIT